MNAGGDPGDEPVEIVDRSGRAQRVVPRREMRAGNLWHRNVAVVVRRPGGAIVVHRRADWKDVHPAHWDIAFGGVPGVGESDPEAAVRELAEEAGLDVAADALGDLGRAVHEDQHTRWVGRFFVVTTDAPLHPADGEVVELAEVPVAGLDAWATTVAVCPDAAPLLAILRAEMT